VFFTTLQARLIAYVNARIQNGEFSERALASLVGVSQPQLHNVLKGERNLHTPLADALLAKFRLSILDLLSPADFLLVQECSRVSTSESLRLHLLKKRPRSISRTDRSEWEAS